MNEILFCGLGMCANLAQVLAEMSQSKGSVVWPHQYALQRPYKLVLAVIGAVIGYQLLQTSGELTLLTAAGAGYMANDAIDRMGKMNSKRATT